MGFGLDKGAALRERLAPRRTGLLGRPVGAGRRPPIPPAVAWYTGRWGWEVVPGAGVRRGPRGARRSCSCGAPGCPTPGAHPLDAALVVPAGAPSDLALAVWSAARARTPTVTVLLPTGRAFDVVEAPAGAARQAVLRMERMGLPVGPVAVAPHGRAWFLVAPGAAAGLRGLLYRTGWDNAALDLRGLGPGDHITAPPSNHAGLGRVSWLRPPDAETATHPPHARLLLGTLAYVCHRANLAARARRTG